MMNTEHNSNKSRLVIAIVCIVFFLTIAVMIYKKDSLFVNFPTLTDSNSNHITNPVDINPTFSTPGYGVVADNQLAVEVGMHVLENGGNAVDAAIAVSYALDVVTPYNSGIGGSGVMVVCPNDGSTPTYYDYIGTCPSYTKGYIAVPGFVKGMETVHNDFGQLSMEELIDPAIELANNGFKVSPLLSKMLQNSVNRISKVGLDNFFPNGKPIASGEILIQPVLAETLETIKLHGYEAFYSGDIATKIVASNIGITLEDLSTYEVKKGDAVKGSFYDYDVYSAAPPLSGITLIQILSLIEQLHLEQYELNSPTYMDLLSKIIALTYQDRLHTIGDPNFFAVDTQTLISDEYITSMIDQISIDSNEYVQTGHNETITTGEMIENTTHIVVVDKDGMMVSVTNTLTNWFGSGKHIDGFFLNSHMTNFSKNSYSLNKIQAGKRARTFLSPAILTRDGKPSIAIGTPGGSRIPMMIAEVLLRIVNYDTNIQTAVSAPRFYFENNVIYVEKLYAYKNAVNALNAQGYSTIEYTYPIYYGGVNVLLVDYDKNIITGGADHRREADCHIEFNY